jgi:RNA polymerase sigma-70 factor (ECF subfamily)
MDDLARLVARGDEDAFDAIYTETVDQIFGYVRGQCGDSTLAEDLVANVFLKAWKSAASYRHGSNNYRRWLFTIARNELTDHWRRHRELSVFEGLDVVDQTEGVEEAISSALANSTFIFSALRQLNDQQREVVVLRFFNELSHAEIARILGKREGAVRAQLLRALRQMRKAISNAAS